ncbi:MAG: ribosome-binding factor A, partial [Synechococcales cyanobacterium CRU_2_2]|nr:ribosome-binding factor A [Synechococcales cyanobacterium CRU_2_2]
DIGIERGSRVLTLLSQLSYGQAGSLDDPESAAAEDFGAEEEE